MLTGPKPLAVRTLADDFPVPSPVWLFDLDNTLHDANPYIFPHIDQAMTAYIGTHLGVDHETATHIRESYWRRYGTTLLGLIRHHDIDPQHFLWHTHQFPDLKRMVVSERGIKAALHRLSGKKIIFSNAPVHYAEAVLKLIGLRNFFDAVYSIERLRFQSKPTPGAFRHLLHAERLSPHRCIFVDDTLSNLKTAKQLGIRTVWVSASTRQSPCVDLKIASVTALPRCLGRL